VKQHSGLYPRVRDCLIFGVTGPDTPRLFGGMDQQ
jgi:hypothetical protein